MRSPEHVARTNFYFLCLQSTLNVPDAIACNILCQICFQEMRRYGTLTLELSSMVLEIPNDAYTTLIRNLVGRETLNQEYCELID